MFSFKNLRAAIFMASATLLSISPLHAAIKTKPVAPSVKSRHTAAPAKVTSKSVSHKDAAIPVAHKSSASASRHSRKGSLKVVAAAKPKSHGQQAIDAARTAEIQEALIRERYLDGEPTGEWDQATRNALTRFQGDHHWQTKIVPDARALIKLGLGPTQQNLLNPESAAISPSYRSVAGISAAGGSN
jgi:hypothetical protein